MKHRALSMLLALVMVVSLLPTAVTANGAEENTGAEEQKETVEMRENDSQQGGDGEKSQLPTEENENGAIVLRLGAESDAATVYTAYQSEVLVLPVLYYTKDNVVINATEELFQKGDVKCYAIQKNSAGRTLFGNLMLRPGNEFNGGNLILWNQLPEDWSGVDSASYVIMFHCNNQWYKLDAQLRAGSEPLVGELVLQYKGNNYFDGNMIELAAGTNEVSLMARDVDNWEMISSKTGLSVDGKVVTGLDLSGQCRKIQLAGGIE